MSGPDPRHRPPPEKETAARVGARGGGWSLHAHSKHLDDSQPPAHGQVARCHRVGAAIANALTIEADIADLAAVCRHLLDPFEIARLTASGLAALDPDPRRRLAEGALRDAAAADPLGAERRRQTRQWLEHVRTSNHRPPPLTPEQERRAAAIDLGTTTSPRERLADAWNTAAERDRRDLIARATGRPT